MRNNIQNRDGLPVALAEEKRFFELYGSGKTDTPNGWNDPENWKYLEDIPEDKYFGFAIGNNSNYLLIDFDHIADSNGNVIPWAYEVYKRLNKAALTYTEISKSRTGLHMICDLGDYADDFARESNSYNQIIIQMDPAEYNALPKEEKDKIPKVEFFYHAAGRYVYLTGKHKHFHEVATDESAAAIFHELLKIRKEFHEKYAKGGALSVDMGADAAEGGGKITLTDAEHERVLEALPYISANARETWVTVGIALCNCGFPFEIWDTWSRFTDQRTGEICDKYDPEETPKIWKSFQNTASRWNAGTIIRMAKENGYRPQKEEPEVELTFAPKQRDTLQLSQYTDVDQAELFASEYGNVLRYSKATGFLWYDGQRWEESDLKAQRLSQILTERQLDEARIALGAARRMADKSAEENGGNIDAEARAAVRAAEHFRKEVIRRRTSQKIKATLAEAAPLVEVDVKQLDRDGFLLNTPGGTVDLRTGESRQHDPKDYCTKITGVAPGTDGAEVFEEFLDQITCNDADLKRYLQEVAGEIAIGEVKQEELFISSGQGGNGKSTYFNLLFRVLGDYAGLLSSDVLITSSRKNKSPELAELRGKRMILAAELEEGQRLDTGMVKKIASTDPIRAERKYRDPFDFIPSHSVILYTNFLPKVGARDSGTWDRLRVIPFNARFRNTSGEIKDYASVLFEKCGGAVLSWIIEGARRYVENGFKIRLPICVTQALGEYREANDWLSAFLAERCFTGPSYASMAGDVYRRYRDYCGDMGDFPRSAAEFKKALESVGIKHKRTKNGGVYIGVSVKGYDGILADSTRAVKEAQESA